jgi:hypothetical protein
VKVLIAAGANDTGGQGWRIVQAFRDTGWEVRSMAKVPTYMNYPVDLPFRKRLLEELYEWCDVMHVRNRFDLYDKLASKFGRKPVVIHFHGSLLRGNPEYWVKEVQKRGATALVSTLDLWLLAPDLFTWLPAPYDVDELEELRASGLPQPRP